MSEQKAKMKSGVQKLRVRGQGLGAGKRQNSLRQPKRWALQFVEVMDQSQR